MAIVYLATACVEPDPHRGGQNELAELCDREPDTCPVDQARVCVPGARRCAADAFEVCVAGRWERRAECEGGCDDSFGCPALRTALINYLWGTEALPDGGPLTAELDISDPWISGITNVAAVDRLTFESPFDDYRVSRLIAYHYHPLAAGERMVLYHDAHCQPHCASAPRAIQFFVDRGYSVMAFAMPMYGPNKDPDWVAPSGRHNLLVELEGQATPVMRLFFDQLARGVNYALAQFGYTDISMIGYSGGGWQSTIYPALDPRITRSFPIAGSMPWYLEQYEEYEQWRKQPLYQLADMPGMYYLAAVEAGRRQVQMLNLTDPCCFAAEGREDQISAYAAMVQSAIERRDDGGGEFSAVVITEHEGHEISQQALDTALLVMNESD